jgi:hypothetical protein
MSQAAQLGDALKTGTLADHRLPEPPKPKGVEGNAVHWSFSGGLSVSPGVRVSARGVPTFIVMRWLSGQKNPAFRARHLSRHEIGIAPTRSDGSSVDRFAVALQPTNDLTSRPIARFADDSGRRKTKRFVLFPSRSSWSKHRQRRRGRHATTMSGAPINTIGRAIWP